MSDGATTAPPGDLRVALVHDYLVAVGGAERTFLSICRMFPSAPIYTGIYRPGTAMPEFSSREVHALWPTHLPLDRRTYRAVFPAYAVAFRSLDLASFDLVISSSSGFAKSAGRRAAAHVAYIHTPPRFIWPVGASSSAGGRMERAAAAALRPLLRPEDLRAARAATTLLANSARTAERIRRFYGREATVVHPPVETARFTPGTGAGTGEYYLTVGRLVPYKGFDDAVAACSATGRRLVVVGEGRERANLERLAGPTVEFAGEVSEERLVELYRGARALLVAGEDDWGMTPLEANACGCPVVAAARGGSLESVVDGVNGVLYQPGPGALAQAMDRLESLDIPRDGVVAHARQYDEAAFQAGIAAAVRQAVA